MEIAALSALVGFAAVVAAWSFLSVAGTDLAARLSWGGEGEGMGLFNACTAIAGVLGSVLGGWFAGMWGYRILLLWGVCGPAAGVLVTLVFVHQENVALKTEEG